MGPLAAAALIALLAMTVRAVTGFGSALVMTPLLVLFFDTRTAVVASAIIQVVTGFGIAYPARRDADRGYLKRMLPFAFAGIVAGTVVLVNLDSALLQRALGAVVVLFALRPAWDSLRPQAAAPARWPLWLGYLAGALSGLLGTLFGTSGPPVVIFLGNQISGKAALRATLLVYFLCLDSIRTAGYVVSSLVTPQVLGLALVMLPAALLGGWLGTRLHLSLGERAFRLSVSALLLATGALLLVKV